MQHRPPYEGGTTKNHEYTIHHKDTGHQIGHATFVPHKSRIMSVGVQHEHRRKGLANALYNHIEKKHNTKLVPNSNAQTDDGQAMWKSRQSKNKD